MEVIVNEDQLSLAIGKRGQNVRLATKLVGWNIDIRSEEEIKKEVAEAMGAMIASGAPVPLSVIEGVTAQQADALSEHGVTDIDGLAATTLDDLVEFLDVSLDEAVEKGAPFSAEETIRAEDSADPVALTEADPMSVGELVLQEAGRDLRPDVVTPAPDISLAVDNETLEDAIAASETNEPTSA